MYRRLDDGKLWSKKSPTSNKMRSFFAHRFFILAAAPSEILPNLPSPTHEFPKTNLSITVGVKYFSSDVSTSSKRLLPSVTVGEALRGLPPIQPGNFEKIRNSYADVAEPGSFDEKVNNLELYCCFVNYYCLIAIVVSSL